MPGLMSILTLLDSVGVSRAELTRAVNEVAKEAVIAKTREVQRYWVSISPGPNPAKPHELFKGDGLMIEPGSYKRAIKTRWEKEGARRDLRKLRRFVGGRG